MKKFKRVIAAGLATLMILPGQMAYGRTDGYIMSDPVVDTFTGRQEGAQLIGNLQFTDMPADPTAQDAIIRSGALNLIKGEGTAFRPGAFMTNQEALAFVLRAANREAEALALGIAERDAVFPDGVGARDGLYLGYLALARNIELITQDQFNLAFDLIEENDLEPLEEVEVWRRTDPVTREVFANWLFNAITSQNANAFNIQPGVPGTLQSIYEFNDWGLITAEHLLAVDNLVRTGVMSGSNNVFRPQANLTRMEAAWIGRSLDTVQHSIFNLERRYGTVGAIVDAQAVAAHYGNIARELRVRRDTGQVDMLRFTAQVGGSPQGGIQDAVVLKNGVVGGLALLDEGDIIEYIVHPASGTVIYVVATGALTVRQVQGRLQNINRAEGTITLLDEESRGHTFAYAQGLVGENADDGSYIRFGTRRQPLNTLPYGSLFRIQLTNNLITEVEFLGGLVLQPETWGVVIANNPMLGYLTILDTQGHERTFTYNANEITVQKVEHFDMRDTIGGIHALFPNMRLNDRETGMNAIEPGNIVSIRANQADPTMIASIHASTNYTTRYGRIMEFRTEGNRHTFLMQYENGLTSWFTMANDVSVRQSARPINAAQIQVGDWARILVNQAVVGSGQVLESVRAMDVEGDARHINNIVRGQLTTINGIQNQMQIQNAQSLERTGRWINYQQIVTYNIGGSQQIEYFFNGRPVTLGYVQNNLRFSGAEVYIALENHHGGERIRMMSFRTGRDELLNPDTVLGIDGHGGFQVLTNNGLIQTDEGTIVRRNGRLVDGRNIMPWDHAVVALNGANNAAVVDISDAPGYAGVMIARGRIYSVDQGRSFRVQSIALFDGTEWRYTPIQREFAIDHNTLFFDESGMTSIDDFIDFGPDSVFFNVYNIVIDGSRAARVSDTPYANQALRGTIHAIEGDTIHLRNVHFHDGNWARQDGWGTFSGRWVPLSVNAPNPAYGLRDQPNSSVAEITVLPNSIIVDRNQVVGTNALRVGDQIRIMTDYRTIRDDSLDRPDRRPPNGVIVDGYVILVER
ncbi:MAG: S-layer homology domain-containing protein [Defluviitaleaceae bacterium]|nr:S-layer homology domain-containing protein [Defluviitaleaceae bacterium]